MTEDTNQQLAAPADADGQFPNSSSRDGTDAMPTPSKKAAPRRKVASRQEKDVAAAPVTVATDEPAAVTGEPLVAKTRRPSRKKAVVAAAADDEPAARETTVAPSFQPELAPVSKEPETSTAQTFDHAPQPVPAAPVREIAPSPSVAPVNDAPPVAAVPIETAPTVGLVAPSPSVAPETATGAPLIPQASEPPRFQQGPPQGQPYQNRPDGNYQQGQGPSEPPGSSRVPPGPAGPPGWTFRPSQPSQSE